MENKNDKIVFWGCFIALITCAFGFVIRTQIIGDWAAEFDLDETEKGRLLAVGWPDDQPPAPLAALQLVAATRFHQHLGGQRAEASTACVLHDRHDCPALAALEDAPIALACARSQGLEMHVALRLDVRSLGRTSPQCGRDRCPRGSAHTPPTVSPAV